ncbi:MAG: 23S rRNA (pseudouridine(1915)-N(3))-methyltransferase RlmH, partial [Bacilli bacterium]|nr:23S rRNA (pseudouridine(1915)-N(3))-methyltransferase RlmH [Bacilli bacterium]
MKIKLVVVGKIKEQFYKDAIDEYMKRISPMANINIIEVKEVNTNDINKNKQEEAKNILEKVDNNDYVITLE